MSGVAAGAASAATFFVNGATGNDSSECLAAATPCRTIGAAIVKSESMPGTATIEVSSGTYQEELDLTHAADNGVAINGAGPSTVVEGPAAATNATVRIVGPHNTASLSNLNVVNPASDEKNGIEVGADVTLDNVSVDMQHAGSGYGIYGTEIGSITINGGGVTMETGSTGAAIFSALDSLVANGTTVTLANGASGAGIATQISPVSLTNVTVNLGNAAKGGGIQAAFGDISLTNVTVNVSSGSTSSALSLALATKLSANGVKVTMGDAASTAPALINVLGAGMLDHIEVGGSWKGPALVSIGADTTLADSRLVSGAGATSPTVIAGEGGEGRGLLVQRSVLQSPPAGPGALFAAGSNATVDSSELLGGTSAASLVHEEGKIRTLTIAGSTIDAGALGVRDGAGVYSVNAVAGGKASAANVNIEGSIVFEPQRAEATAAGDSASVTCTSSDAPNQTQAAKGTEGTIACGSGTNGNNTTEPLTALFGPSVTNYAPIFGSSAIDSVPAGAISLPFGIAPSSTDLLGNPRVVDGNGDCIALQDKGAIELQGHSAPCPPAAKPPVAGSITNLSIAPNAFLAAPSGATVSMKHKAKKKYGATVSYKDTQAATTTFTVLRPETGRTQGKSCKKPSKKNKHGKRCTLYKALGSFTHTDTAGTNKFHFSGRIKGNRLAKGSYKLQAVPHNAAGNGRAVSKQFKIK